MTLNTRSVFLAASTLACGLLLGALVSCGGGGVGSGGTGAETGVSVGTVNGFGSVIVDGVRYDDRSASVLAEVGPDHDAIAEVKLGDRVSVVYQTAGVASVVRVEASLAGPVDSVASPAQFAMLGQTVTVNSIGTAGPITQFGGGYVQASDVRAGDAVEVHGILVRQGDTAQLQATRVEKLAALPGYLRVTGLVKGLGTGEATTFALGTLTVDASAASVLPTGSNLANGQSVSVLALPSTLMQPGPGVFRLQAALVRIRGLSAGGLDDYLSGSVAQLDPQARTFTLGSQRVVYAAATVTPATMSLANGQYVQVRGMGSTDGSLAAASVTIRDAGSELEAELRGNISGFDAVTRSFSVRGVRVDASRALPESCPNGGLADGLFVEVKGAVSSNGVVARSIHCEDEPPDTTVQREGVAASVDVAARSFSLVPERGSPQAVTWTDATFFGEVTAQTLSGNKVQVEGRLVGAVLVAAKIKR